MDKIDKTNKKLVMIKWLYNVNSSHIDAKWHDEQHDNDIRTRIIKLYRKSNMFLPFKHLW